MSREHFQIVAVGNLLLILAAEIVGVSLIDALPGTLAQFVHEQLSQPIGIYDALSVVLFAGLVAGHYGLTRFRRWARPVVVASMIGAILSNLLGGAYVGHQVEVLLFDTFLVLEGVLIACAYMGAASREFSGQTESPPGKLTTGIGSGSRMRADLKGALAAAACTLILGSAAGYAAHEYAIQRYAIAQLEEVEGMSTEFYTQFPPKASQTAQGVYVVYAYTAWKEGAISSRSYHRAQAIGWLRYCTEEADQGETDRAEKLCEMAREEFRRWGPAISFSNFEKMVTSRRVGEYRVPQ